MVKEIAQLVVWFVRLLILRQLMLGLQVEHGILGVWLWFLLKPTKIKSSGEKKEEGGGIPQGEKYIHIKEEETAVEEGRGFGSYLTRESICRERKSQEELRKHSGKAPAQETGSRRSILGDGPEMPFDTTSAASRPDCFRGGGSGGSDMWLVSGYPFSGSVGCLCCAILFKGLEQMRGILELIPPWDNTF